jgi:hypothetical protein
VPDVAPRPWPDRFEQAVCEARHKLRAVITFEGIDHDVRLRERDRAATKDVRRSLDAGFGWQPGETLAGLLAAAADATLTALHEYDADNPDVGLLAFFMYLTAMRRAPRSSLTWSALTASTAWRAAESEKACELTHSAASWAGGTRGIPSADPRSPCARSGV